jgi:2-amino-4-hydroxy-6-hydroxymethyldihydropteridine diphosphokinase
VTPVFIGLGSNVEDRVQHLRDALRALSGLPLSALAKVSSFYDTEPVGDPRVPRYVNAVARLDSDLPPESVHEALVRIEADGGRGPAHRSGARTIDLDLLYHGERVLRRPGFELPHPWIADRLFVLIPMLEIAPEWTDPVLGVRLSELLGRRRNQASVRWLAPPVW